MGLRFKVLVSPKAKGSLRAIISFVKSEAGEEAAQKVSSGLLDAIESLQTAPRRCGKVILEGRYDREIRRLNKWSYAIYFEIVDASVIILNVLHSSQKNQSKGYTDD